MGLLTAEQEDFARKRLIRALENYGWRLGTGFLSTPFILFVLEKIGIEYAYKLLENEELPGWLVMPKARRDDRLGSVGRGPSQGARSARRAA